MSKRQASSAVTVEPAPSGVIKLLECNAKEINASAAALRVAQSELPMHSWILCNRFSKLCGAIAPTCNNLQLFGTVHHILKCQITRTFMHEIVTCMLGKRNEITTRRILETMEKSSLTPDLTMVQKKEMEKKHGKKDEPFHLFCYNPKSTKTKLAGLRLKLKPLPNPTISKQHENSC